MIAIRSENPLTALACGFAPRDERSWLALGACHEARQQPHVALELYTTGRVLASAPSYRCELARARVLRALGSEDEADDGLAAAQRAAEALGDDDARAQVERERGVGT